MCQNMFERLIWVEDPVVVRLGYRMNGGDRLGEKLDTDESITLTSFIPIRTAITICFVSWGMAIVCPKSPRGPGRGGKAVDNLL